MILKQITNNKIEKSLFFLREAIRDAALQKIFLNVFCYLNVVKGHGMTCLWY